MQQASTKFFSSKKGLERKKEIQYSTQETYKMCLNNCQNLLRPQVPGAKAESLDIKSIAGIFVLLVMGLVLALVIAIAERLLYGFT